MMENLEPKKKRSPIESLKFQRKSDYKKFRNFIKKETKQLAGIVEPKEDKLKQVLKVGAGGLGIFALGSLFRGKRGGKGDGEENFPFAIGRVNPPLPKTPAVPNPRKRNPVKLKPPKSPVTRRGVEVYRRGEETKKTQARQQVKRKVRGKKVFKKQNLL